MIWSPGDSLVYSCGELIRFSSIVNSVASTFSRVVVPTTVPSGSDTIESVTFDNTADTITLSLKDQALGKTWAILGYADEQFIDIISNTGSTANART